MPTLTTCAVRSISLARCRSRRLSVRIRSSSLRNRNRSASALAAVDACENLARVGLPVLEIPERMLDVTPPPSRLLLAPRKVLACFSLPQSGGARLILAGLGACCAEDAIESHSPPSKDAHRSEVFLLQDSPLPAVLDSDLCVCPQEIPNELFPRAPPKELQGEADCPPNPKGTAGL
mmetsp:Transcript_24623/g.51548  ORF Transcript_24623/g.51548 Transcript_24623/m.51548 type:complete len:177 (-) Transcript_24623:916-1446(-)